MKNCLIAVVLALPLAACMNGTPRHQPAQAALLRSEAKNTRSVQVTLYTLDPYRSMMGQAREPDTFHGYGVVGKTTITAAADKEMLLDSLASGMEYSKDSAHVCFNPRHGLSIVSGGQTTDYVICFQCLRMKVYRDGAVQNILISNSPARVYASVVKKCNVTPPPK